MSVKVSVGPSVKLCLKVRLKVSVNNFESFVGVSVRTCVSVNLGASV